MTPKFTFPEDTFLIKSRFIYTVIHLTCPFLSK
jgi:hypothetical protein